MALEVILIFTLCLWLLRRYFSLSKWDHFPGFKSFESVPIIGHGMKLGNDNQLEVLETYRKRFGDVFRLDFGDTPTVIVCNSELLHRILHDQRFSQRVPQGLLTALKGLDDQGTQPGVSVLNGAALRETKKFLVRALNANGFLKKGLMDSIIQEEAKAIVDLLKRESLKNNNKVAMFNFFLVSTNNVIWRMITGYRTSLEDEKIRSLTRGISDILLSASPKNLLTMLQAKSLWFARLCYRFNISTMVKAGKPMLEMLEKEIDESEADLEGNLIDRNLAEIEKNRDAPESIFHGERGRLHLKINLLDLFLAGTDTTAGTMEYLMLHLSIRAESRKRIYDELKKATLSFSEEISWEARDGCPFTLSFIEEVLRVLPGAPLMLPRYITHDVRLDDDGLLFPKGTQVLVNAYSAMREEKHFKEPNKFKPDRFIDPETGRFRPSKNCFTFSTGPRHCIGEPLSRAEVFIFLGYIMKHFDFRFPLDEATPDFSYTFGRIIRAKPYDLIFEQRI